MSSEDAGVSPLNRVVFVEFSQQIQNPKREILDKAQQGICPWVLGSEPRKGQEVKEL